MKLQKKLILLIILLPIIIVSCEKSEEENPQPDNGGDDNSGVGSITLLLDSICINQGNIPNNTNVLELEYQGDTLFLIEGKERFVKFEPDTSIISGFYIQIEGQNEFQCTKYLEGFIKLGVVEKSIFNVTFCAYDENKTVLDCFDIPVKVEEESEVIFCIAELENKIWDWKYELWDGNIANYKGVKKNPPQYVSGYCQTGDGAVVNDVLLEEEGGFLLRQLIMDDENNSFDWKTKEYSKHWDILTTDCNQAGYDVDTLEQFFEGDYLYDDNNSKLTLNFDTQRPEEGTYDIFMSCNLLVISKFSSGSEGGGIEITYVFEKYQEE